MFFWLSACKSAQGLEADSVHGMFRVVGAIAARVPSRFQW